MSLATRCSGCGTLFRVVQDQLKVSEGWVRCGRCDAVFNALESLFDLEAGTQAAAVEPAGAATDAGAVVETASVPASTDAVSPAAPDSVSGDDRSVPAASSEAPLSGFPAADAAEPATHARLTAPPPADFDAPFELAWPERGPAAAPEPPASVAAPARSTAADDAMSSFLATPAPLIDTPALAREASLAAEPPLFTRPELRRSPVRRRRWPGLLAAALLMLLLGAQLLHHARDLVAARWPALRPTLAAACSALACRLEPPRRIDEVAVENTALTATATPGAYRLSVGLRNRADTLVATPSIDLALTDTNGQLLARRVLGPRDFAKAPLAIGAGEELPLQALITAPGGRVSGYTVELFYP